MPLRRLSVLTLSQSHLGREKDGPLAGTKEAGTQPDAKWEPRVSTALNLPGASGSPSFRQAMCGRP